MALNTRLCVADRNAAVDAITATIGASGFMDLYDGTQPTDPDTALGAQVKLARLPLSATAFAAASGGSAAANAITSDSSADATGTCTWGTLCTSAGVRKKDFSVGTSGANLNLNSVAISAGAVVAVTSFSLSLPMQGA
jgi:hypothetical protein